MSHALQKAQGAAESQAEARPEALQEIFEQNLYTEVSAHITAQILRTWLCKDNQLMKSYCPARKSEQMVGPMP